jgi:fibronectin-binding autotransporter adhesin
MKKLLSWCSTFVLSFSSLLVFVPHAAHAATIAWDGEGADENFSTAANWTGDIVPSDGDILQFPTSVDSDTTDGDDRVLNNDLTGFSAGGLQVTGTYAADDFDEYEITGNAMTVTGNILGNSESAGYPWLHIDFTITLGANITILALDSTGGLAMGSYNATLQDSRFDGAITGSGTLTHEAAPTNGGGGLGGGCDYGTATPSPFGGDGSGFSGPLIITDMGIWISSRANDITRHASTITVNGDSYLGFNLDSGQDLTFSTPLTLNGGTIYVQQLPATEDCGDPTTYKTATISGSVNVTAAVDVIMSRANVKLTGSVTGGSNLTVPSGHDAAAILTIGSTEQKSVLKTTTITDANKATYCDSSYGLSYYVDENNRFNITVDCTGTSESTHQIAGILGGTGKVGPISILAGGKLAPGLSPGCLSSGNVAMIAGSTFEAELGGTTECTAYDQQVVTGTVSLGNATLSTLIVNDFKPAAGNTFTIIKNDGTDAVTGTFNNLAQGATFTVDGYVLAISYTGGDGNDVVLTVQSVPAAPDTGFVLTRSTPAITLIATLFATTGLLVLARRYSKLPL